jgi:hydroxymethylpyrimidine/phosphomethylpyrimidine kinase
MEAKGRVLIIAGSDSGGGAGVQADIKTVTALGGYAATAITALTAQNTQGVHGVHGVPADFIVQQIQVVLEDIGADCIKTGMLHDVPTIEAVAGALDSFAKDIPLVADPVMVAQSGHQLLAEDAAEALMEKIVGRARLATPNVPEAIKLTGMEIADLDSQRAAAQALVEMGPDAVLLKGGHLEGPILHDVLATPAGVEVFESPRIETNSTHGTGCTLASAIATGFAQHLSLREAVVRARIYLHHALRTATPLGHGHGPVNHLHTVKPLIF